MDIVIGKDGECTLINWIRRRITIGSNGRDEEEADEAIFGEWIEVDLNKVMVGEEKGKFIST